MATSSTFLVGTDLGRLSIQRSGTGPPVVLWHSLFVDSGSWDGLVDALAVERTVYTIDGPSHGKSDAVHRDFTFEECVAAAEQALDRLRLDEPVDYVVTLNGGSEIDERAVIARMLYTHPVYTRESVAAQTDLPSLDDDRLAFAGAYHGWGFHEDGCAAGVRAAHSLGVTW